MKKLYFAALLCCSFLGLNAQDITGSWVGLLQVGSVKLHLVFNIKKTAEGGYTATFDSPDQKVSGIVCSKTFTKQDSLLIEIAVINGGYKGLQHGRDSISGLYYQGNAKIPLGLKRLTAENKSNLVKEPLRPQTPKPPYGYYSEEVEYDNADKSLHYGATFTRPNGSGKYPAVIIISGSGTQDRDGTLFGHKLYWVLADYLSKNGIAVLRVDDRGAGKSSLGNNIKDVTSLDFSYDVESSLNYLERRNDVDNKHLGLIGHSEGGIIAPMVAARRKDVNFIVMWAGPEVGGAKIIAEQTGYALKAAGIDTAASNSYAHFHQQLLDLFAQVSSKEELHRKILPQFEAWKTAQSKKTLDALYVNGNVILKRDIFKTYDSLYEMAWTRFFIAYQPEKDLLKVKCSVLAVNGEKDTQVLAGENLALIKKILTESGNKDFEVKAIPNLNHLMQTATTGDVSEYEQIQETISPAALNIICNWIKLHTK